MSFPRLALPALLALVLVALPSSAQDSTARSGAFLGGGINISRSWNQSMTASLALQLGYDWRSAASRVGVRLTGDYAANATRTRLFPYSFNADRGVTVSETRSISHSVWLGRTRSASRASSRI